MHEIVAHRLWIGNALDARNLRELHALGIVAVVDLAMEEPPIGLTRELIYCRFPLVDGAGNDRNAIALALSTTVSLIRQAVPTLVACGAGMSRSPAMAATALATIGQASPEDLLLKMVAGKPHDVSPLFWASLQAVAASEQR